MRKTDNHQKYRKRFDSIYAFGSDVIIVTDPQGNIRRFNRQLTEVIDYPHETLIKKNIADLLPEEERSVIGTLLGDATRGKAVRGTFRFNRKIKPPISATVTVIKIAPREIQFIIHIGGVQHSEKSELIRHNKETVALHEIGKQIATSFDLDRVLSSIVNNLIWLLECQFAGVALFDSSVSSVSYQALGGDRSHETRRIQLDVGKEVPGIIVATRTPLLIKDFPNDPPMNPRDYPVIVAEGLCTVFGVPLTVKGKIFGALVTGYRTKHEYTEDEMGLIANLANQSAMAIENARLYQSSLEHSKALEMLTIRLSKIQEEERRKISRELHDSVGQALTGLHLNLDLLSNDISAREQSAIDKIRNMKLIINETLNDIRQMAFELRPTILDDFGIIPALRLYLNRFSKQTNIEIIFSLPEKLIKRTPKGEAALYRVVQEAMTNVVKHSHAKRVSITVNSTPTMLTLDVIDDGVGFDAARLQKAEYLYQGLGLLSMRERIVEVDGILRIKSEVGQGTTIHIEIPLLGP
jgi:PAS domain S-box-containing protein